MQDGTLYIKIHKRNFAHKISISRLKIGMYDTSNHIHEHICLALLGLCTASEFQCFCEVGGGLAINHKEEIAKFGYMSDRKCLVFHATTPFLNTETSKKSPHNVATEGHFP